VFTPPPPYTGRCLRRLLLGLIWFLLWFGKILIGMCDPANVSDGAMLESNGRLRWTIGHVFGAPCGWEESCGAEEGQGSRE
jgi:hypothetical protein